MANYSLKNVFPTPYRLATIGLHPLRTDRQTDGQTTGRRQLMPIARPLLKYGRLKRRWKRQIHFLRF